MKRFIAKAALATLVFLGWGGVSALAQQVTGKVTDVNGEAVIGAAVMIQGTTRGTTTDIDGTYEIAAGPRDVLEFQSIGYANQTVPVNGRSIIDVVLEDDALFLGDVVVVGYGVQKKSVVTAAISSITAEDLKVQPQTRVDNMLRGMSSGVVVTQTSGAPDASSQIRIRGVGTIHNSAPLYIIDGMPSDAGGIDYLNPNDIERIEVLKDAASGAVYGARAANGVILVTTKKGAKGNAKVSYDFSYGLQNVWRKPAVLNATEYAVMMNEGAINAGREPIYADPYSYGEGTDWVDAIFDKNAPVVKHDLSISGGSERMDYSFSAGYLSRDGIIGGSKGRSNYDRFTLRENLGFTIFDESESRNWLNKLTARTTTSYAHIEATGLSTNSEYGSPLGSALGMSPIETIFADDATVEQYKVLYPAGFPYAIRDASGRYYTIADGSVYNEQYNPIADLERPGTIYQTDKIVANLSAELQIWDAIKFRSSVGLDLAFWGNHGYSSQYFLTNRNYSYDTVTETTTYDAAGNASTVSKTNYGSSASQELSNSFTWQVENVLSYDKNFGQHGFNVVLGQTAYRSTSANVGASARGLRYPDDEWKISVNNTLGQQADGDRNGWGSWNSIPYSLISYFGRVSYNYDERYMAEFTLRRDASSRFGPSNKWGTFPSVSVGWNLKNEDFMKNVPSLSALKVRASWGVNGSDNIGDFGYAVYASSGNNYAFGSGANGTETLNQGTKPDGLANPNIKWEESSQTDLGVDFGFFGGKFSGAVDYYVKKTTGMLLSMPVPTYAGDSAPTGNLGDMQNSGIEFDFNYRNHAGDVYYHIGANASYNKNKLTYLGDEATYLSGSTHKLGTLTWGTVGMPFPYFYGYKVDGVFQNQEEIDAYVDKNGNLIQPNAKPGDFRFKDINGDGVLDDDNDRTYLGKGMPDWTFGINLGFEYKGFDFSMLIQGQAGAQILNVTRRTDLNYINLPKKMLYRWTGEGSTNEYPIFSFNDANLNNRPSDYWMEDASFLRARNIQCGYTIPENISKKAGIARARVYGQVENAFTLTSYTGCDPEVTGGNSGYGTETGIDRGVYPQSRVVTFGVSLNF